MPSDLCIWGIRLPYAPPVIRVAVFDDEVWARFAKPRSVGRRHGGMDPCTLCSYSATCPKPGSVLLSRHHSKPSPANTSTRLSMLFDRVAWASRVVRLMDTPPRAGVASRERDAVVPIRGGSTISNPSAASLGNRPASSSIPSDAPMVPAPAQPGLLYRGDVAVVGGVDRVGLGDGVQRVEPMSVSDTHVFQDQGHDRHAHGLHIR